MPKFNDNRVAVREGLRHRRRAIKAIYAEKAAHMLKGYLYQTAEFQRAKKLAGYLPVGSEMSPLPCMRLALSENKRVFVPVLTNTKELLFAPWTPTATTQRNAVGIEEPCVPEHSFTEGIDLDLILTPLLGFDQCGNRLGTGGGYYDRTFSGKVRFMQPLLCGVAYACQEIDHLPAQPWDIPLDLIITENGVHYF